MKCDKYQRIATEHADYGEGDPITYPVFGMCGEVAELLEVYHECATYEDCMHEVGDVLWYATNMASDIKHPLSEILGVESLKCVTPGHSYLRTLPIFSGAIAEQVKKALRDDHGQFGRRTYPISLALCGVIRCLQGIARDLGGSLDEAAKMNLVKIKAKREKKGRIG